MKYVSVNITVEMCVDDEWGMEEAQDVMNIIETSIKSEMEGISCDSYDIMIDSEY